jgi:glycosyltransferase involved in cell wall biosynthesis
MLGHTVNAVMDQDLDAEFEMIVVDDASPDSTPELMREAVRRAPHALIYARLGANRGPAGGRNVGIALAQGEFIAFTDSDCIPDPAWLRAAVAAFSSPGVGMVQGRTEAAGNRPPFFSHYIETLRLDGSFSTSNTIYRRKAIGDHWFDPACTYNSEGRPDSNYFWEDVDLGWRVLADGWTARFAGDAIVRHEVILLTPTKWMLWPRHLALMPAKVAKYPGFRRYLFLGVWIAPIHLWFDLAVVGVLAAPFYPLTLLFTLPYAVEFARRRGLKGKFPPAKVAAYLAWDVVSLGTLLASSVRRRCLVL